MTGIYILKNTQNGKVYVGQSKNTDHRKSCHFCELKNNKHKNQSLQKEYNENPNAFIFETVCSCGEEELNDLEKYYIHKYKSDQPENGYNIESGGIKGHVCTDGAKRKIAEKNKGNKNMCGIKLTEEWKRHLAEAQPHSKKVVCIETGIEYPSFAEAARKTGLNRTKIVSVCTGKRKTTGGFHFKYVE